MLRKLLAKMCKKLKSIRKRCSKSKQVVVPQETGIQQDNGAVSFVVSTGVLVSRQRPVPSALKSCQLRPRRAIYLILERPITVLGLLLSLLQGNPAHDSLRPTQLFLQSKVIELHSKLTKQKASAPRLDTNVCGQVHPTAGDCAVSMTTNPKVRQQWPGVGDMVAMFELHRAAALQEPLTCKSFSLVKLMKTHLLLGIVPDDDFVHSLPDNHLRSPKVKPEPALLEFQCYRESFQHKGIIFQTVAI